MAESIIRIIVEERAGSKSTKSNNLNKDISDKFNSILNKLEKKVQNSSTRKSDKNSPYATQMNRASKQFASTTDKLAKDISSITKEFTKFTNAMSKATSSIKKNQGSNQSGGGEGQDAANKKTPKKKRYSSGYYAAAALTIGGFAGNAINKYAQLRNLEAGVNTMDALNYAQSKQQTRFDASKAGAGAIGAGIGGLIGGLVTLGNPLGIAVGASIGGGSAYSGLELFYGQQNARRQMQYQAGQQYFEGARGNPLQQQASSVFQNANKYGTNDLLIRDQLSQFGGANQFGALAGQDMSNIANVARRWQVNSDKLAKSMLQLNSGFRNMPALTSAVDKLAYKYGGDVLGQLNTAVGLKQQAGLSTSQALNVAFTQSLAGSNFAAAQNTFLGSTGEEQLNIRAGWKLLGIDYDRLMAGDTSERTKYNNLSIKNQKNYNPSATGLLKGRDIQDTLFTSLAKNSNIGFGQINPNEAATGQYTDYSSIPNSQAEDVFLQDARKNKFDPAAGISQTSELTDAIKDLSSLIRKLIDTSQQSLQGFFR